MTPHTSELPGVPVFPPFMPETLRSRLLGTRGKKDQALISPPAGRCNPDQHHDCNAHGNAYRNPSVEHFTFPC